MFFCQLFQHPAVQDPVHCKRFQALFHSSQKLLMDQILHIKKLYTELERKTMLLCSTFNLVSRIAFYRAVLVLTLLRSPPWSL